MHKGTETNKRSSADRKKASPKKWSAGVTQNSDALDLEDNVFTWSDPKKIALSLKGSAEKSKRKKGTPLQSAMSMLNFYINRGGDNIPDKQKDILEKAKDELRKAFGRPVKGSEK